MATQRRCWPYHFSRSGRLGQYRSNGRRLRVRIVGLCSYEPFRNAFVARKIGGPKLEAFRIHTMFAGMNMRLLRGVVVVLVRKSMRVRKGRQHGTDRDDAHCGYGQE
jgi:hypothetical protein